METGIELRTADRDTLIALIVQQRDLIMRQQAIIESLEQRVAQLEGRAKSKGSGRMPGLKPKADGKPDQPTKPRKGRRQGSARTRMTPTQRVEKHIKSRPRTGYGELFVFVAEPEAPSDNNAAERSLRPVVTSRKISGGTRSQRGTDTKMTLASIFGAWRAQGLNTLTTCRQLLASPQV